MRTRIVWLLAVLLLAVLCLTACDVGEPSTQTVCEKNGHRYTATVLAPTKTEGGYTTYTCAVCGDTYKDNYTQPTGSLGLAYTANGDGKTCTVTGPGTCIDSEIIIPSIHPAGYEVTAIGNDAFYGCSNLTRITISDSVTSIGVEAFSGCSSLTSITIPASVTSIGNSAFSNCHGLTSITIPDSVTSIGNGTFYGCSNLTRITIPASVTSIGPAAFFGCISLTSITIPSSVTSIGGSAFSNCRNLTSITIPVSVTSIGDGAFEYCYKLVEVYNLSSLTITEGSAGNGYVGYYALVVHTSAAKASNVFIDANGYIFYENGNTCYLLGYTGSSTTLTLPANCNGKNYDIYQYAFYNCSSLTSITIPEGVTSIRNYAFYGCSSLTSITFGCTIAHWNAISKESFWNYNTGAYKVTCTDGVINK